MSNILTAERRIVTAGPGVHIGDYFLAEEYDADSGRYNRAPHFVEGYKLELYTKEGKLRCASPKLQRHLDISWLPFASEQYHISPNIEDYVLTDVPIVVADYPNRNMDAFGYSELTTWRTILGNIAYATFLRKPVHQDHDNQVDERAKGVIFDASLIPFRGKWHVKILKGFDRSKDPRLADLVQKRNRIGHSMGALVERTRCSFPQCRFLSDGQTTCEHIANGTGKGQIVKGHLIYEEMLDFYYIESSSVEDPAYVVALSDHIW
jgi:hypothetical protein